MNEEKLEDYFRKIDYAWNSWDGYLASAYFSYRDEHRNNKNLRVVMPEVQASFILDSPLDDVAGFHIKCMMSLKDGAVVDAFNHQYSMLQSLIKIFQAEREQTWILHVLETVCLELRLLAGPADAAAANVKNPVECMEKTAESLMQCFRICASDNRPFEQDTKKWGMLMLANQMFKVYFKIQRYHLCKPLIRAIESCSMKDEFLLTQRITYKFYTGQLAVFNLDYKQAEECFSFCFENCPDGSWKNKRRILIYLVPIKMYLGLMPKKSLLEKYELTIFQEVVDAVKQGNHARLNKFIEENKPFLCKHSIYIVVDRLCIIARRNLLKKVYHIVGSDKVPVEMFFKALLATGLDDVTWEEAEGLLANLIDVGMVKGHISSHYGMLVLSKTNPFPPLSSVK